MRTQAASGLRRRPTQLDALLNQGLELEHIKLLLPQYATEQNLIDDASNGPVDHPQIGEMFSTSGDGRYVMRQINA